MKKDLKNINNTIIPIYKPKNWPSFKVVKILRKITNTKKIGYLGTLDPQAEGVLAVGIGKGTKKLKDLPKDKTYIAEIAFGIDSKTWDLDSKKIALTKKQKIKKKDIKSTLKNLTGLIQQTIPLYSAKKIKGKKLYQIARAQKKFSKFGFKKLPQKKVVIYKIKLIDFKKKKIVLPSNTNQIGFNKANLFPPKREICLQTIKLKIECGPGTFIRSLAYELGKKMKTKATLIKLIRTKEGGFKIEEALKIANIELRERK